MSESARWRGAARGALSFLTAFGGKGATPSPESMTFFPVIGAGLGMLDGALWRLAARHFDPLLSASLVVLADALATGALHLDGLADAADGLGAHVPVRSRLEIMAEPQIGTFGSLALGGALVLRTGALGALEPSAALLGALWCCSRSVMVLGSRFLPYAREQGLGSAFLPPSDDASTDAVVVSAIAGIGSSFLLGYLGAGRRGLEGVLAGAIAGAGVLALAERRLGGFTGDVLGASGVVCESVGLVVAARA